MRVLWYPLLPGMGNVFEPSFGQELQDAFEDVGINSLDLMGDKIPGVLSYSSSDYSQDLSLLIIRQTGPGGDHLGQVVRNLVLFWYSFRVQRCAW